MPPTWLNYDHIVWDPLTNEQRCLPRPSPPPNDVSCNAAVLCAAAEGCDHRKCHGGPFRVAFIWRHGLVMYARRVYSSERDNWSEVSSVQELSRLHPMLRCRNTLVGDTLYFHRTLKYALEYQLGAQRLSIIERPPPPVSRRAIWVIPMGDSGLGCMDIEEDESSLHLQLWSREAASDSDEVARWTRGRAIDLEELLPDGALPSLFPRRLPSVRLLGFAEGTDVIFVGTWARNHPNPHAVYTVQLNSGRARKVLDQCTFVVPYTSFCIPGIIYAAKYLLISLCATALLTLHPS